MLDTNDYCTKRRSNSIVLGTNWCQRERNTLLTTTSNYSIAFSVTIGSIPNRSLIAMIYWRDEAKATQVQRLAGRNLNFWYDVIYIGRSSNKVRTCFVKIEPNDTYVNMDVLGDDVTVETNDTTKRRAVTADAFADTQRSHQARWCDVWICGSNFGYPMLPHFDLTTHHHAKGMSLDLGIRR